ncbi:MAG: hypothetical protein Q4G27_05865 [Flavobacteriaceae bacterium]|nr:hypothetical protein [Flavobacteriaceae bacterium]
MKRLFLSLGLVLLGGITLANTNENALSYQNMKSSNEENYCEKSAHNFVNALEQYNTSLSSNELVDAYNFWLNWCYSGFRIR